MNVEGEPRAEEIVVEIYRQISLLRTQGIEPTRICLPGSYVRRLRIYRLLLGSVEQPGHDYLGQHTLFGIEFFVDGSRTIKVD